MPTLPPVSRPTTQASAWTPSPANAADGIFSLYRTASDGLAAGKPLPPQLQAALDLLKRSAAQRGGKLSMLDVRMLPEGLARMMATLVTGERGSALAQKSLAARGVARPSREQLFLEMMQHMGAPQAALSEKELTPTWAAQTFCRTLLNHAAPPDLQALAKREGGDFHAAPGPATAKRYHDLYQAHVKPFNERSQAIARDLRRAPQGSARKTELRERLRVAEEERWFLGGGAFANGASLQQAAHVVGADALAVYQELSRARAQAGLAADPPPQPHVGHRYAQELSPAGLGVLNLGAETRQRALGTLPVMERIEQALVQEGLLRREDLERTQLGLRDHLTQVVEQMLNRLCRRGAAHVHVSGKGVSTVPLVAVSMGHRAIDVDSGINDSKIDTAAVIEKTRGEMVEWGRAAARKGFPLLIVGDGSETARAAHEASLLLRKEHPSLRIGYVAVTQSELNVLVPAQEAGALEMDVTSLAGTVLKDLGTSQDIADWIVAHEAAWIDEQKMPALKESHTVVIGGGNIGAALAKGLVDLGAERITIVDPEVEAVRARLRSMGLGDKGIAVQAREGSEPLPVAPYYFSAVGRRSIVDAGTLRAMPDGAVVMNCASRGEVDETFIVQASAGTSPDVLEAHERESGLLREHTTLTTTLRAADGGKGPTVHLRRMGQPAFDGIQDKNVPCIDVTFAGALAALAEVLERLSKPGGWVPQLLYLCAVRQAQVFEAARASGYDLDVDAALEALKANDGRSR